jgi:hypothetical protein
MMPPSPESQLLTVAKCAKQSFVFVLLDRSGNITPTVQFILIMEEFEL